METNQFSCELAYKFVCVCVGDKLLSAEDGLFPCRISDAHCGFEAVGWQGRDICLTSDI